ncbi:MAG TPA: hypothetical protein VMW39_03910 [bacterium]|nr:hypothetical protein [bacterium]
MLPLKDEVVAIEQSPKMEIKIRLCCYKRADDHKRHHNGGLPIDTLKMPSYVSYLINFYRSE